MAKCLVVLGIFVFVVCCLVTRRSLMDLMYGNGAKTECESLGGRWDQKQLYCNR